MKDKYKIINEMVSNVTDVMEAKVEEMELIAQQFDDKGDERAKHIKADVPEIRKAIKIMRKLEGCWA